MLFRQLKSGHPWGNLATKPHGKNPSGQIGAWYQNHNIFSSSKGGIYYGGIKIKYLNY